MTLTPESPWLAQTRGSRYPKLQHAIDVDTVVVGGGVTGVTTAYLLKKAGQRVALIERGRVGWGATGRSTSLVSGVTELPLTTLVDRIGEAAAQHVWEAGFAAMSRVRATVRDERIKCQFSWVPGYLHARDASKRARRVIEQQAAAAEALGIDARFVESVPGFDVPGVVFSNQARLHPLHYLQVMLDRIEGDGSFVFEESEVTAIEDGPSRVHVGRVCLTPQYVVIATHLPITRDAWNPMDLTIRTSHAVRGVAPRGACEEGLYWCQREGSYEYLRVDRHESHDEVILGRHEAPAGNRLRLVASGDALAADLMARVPGTTVTHRWNGQIVLTRDGLPVIGEVSPTRFAATGFGSNGMTFGTLAGIMATDAALGRVNPWRDLFALGRTFEPGDVWNQAAPAPRRMAAAS